MLDNRQLRNLSRFHLAAFALLFLLFWINVLGANQITYKKNGSRQ